MISENPLEWLLNILTLGFKKDYIDNLILRIEQDESKNIYSMADLAVKYPELKDKILEMAKLKFKRQTDGFDVCVVESSSKTFMWFGDGIKLIQSLINQIALSEFATKNIVESVVKTFSSAVATDNWILKSYHNSDKRLELYEIKEIPGKNSKSPPSFEIAYLSLNVSARKIENFLYCESNTKVDSTIKVKKFANLQGLYEWAAE